MLERFEPFWADLELSHADMDRKVAQRAHEALLEAMPRKLAYLRTVLAECGVSLEGGPRQQFKTVCEWLGTHARKMKLSEQLLAARAKQLAGAPREIVDTLSDTDLDLPTLSMCHYAGYFFSELLREECPHAQYILAKDKRNIDYNRTVLAGPTPWAQLEPVRIVMNICYECIENRGKLSRMDPLKLYDIWKGDICGKE